MFTKWVALLTEGVDRNPLLSLYHFMLFLSPSSRRAWIEIALVLRVLAVRIVALLTEGVDRNLS